MATAQDNYTSLVKNRITPLLRSEGFKGSSNNYMFTSTNCWGLVGVQRYRWSNQEIVRFTINIAVVPRSDWEAARRGKGLPPREPRANAHSWPGQWWRIGSLLPEPKDTWWSVSGDEDWESVAHEVLSALTSWGLPAMWALLRTCDT